MRHSSPEAGDASEIRVVCIGHLARVRSWLTASEGVEVAPAGEATEPADVAPRGVRVPSQPAECDSLPKRLQ